MDDYKSEFSYKTHEIIDMNNYKPISITPEWFEILNGISQLWSDLRENFFLKYPELCSPNSGIEIDSVIHDKKIAISEEIYNYFCKLNESLSTSENFIPFAWFSQQSIFCKLCDMISNVDYPKINIEAIIFLDKLIPFYINQIELFVSYGLLDSFESILRCWFRYDTTFIAHAFPIILQCLSIISEQGLICTISIFKKKIYSSVFNFSIILLQYKDHSFDPQCFLAIKTHIINNLIPKHTNIQICSPPEISQNSSGKPEDSSESENEFEDIPPDGVRHDSIRLIPPKINLIASTFQLEDHFDPSDLSITENILEKINNIASILDSTHSNHYNPIEEFFKYCFCFFASLLRNFDKDLANSLADPKSLSKKNLESLQIKTGQVILLAKHSIQLKWGTSAALYTLKTLFVLSPIIPLLFQDAQIFQTLMEYIFGTPLDPERIEIIPIALSLLEKGLKCEITKQSVLELLTNGCFPIFINFSQSAYSIDPENHLTCHVMKLLAYRIIATPTLEETRNWIVGLSECHFLEFSSVIMEEAPYDTKLHTSSLLFLIAETLGIEVIGTDLLEIARESLDKENIIIAKTWLHVTLMETSLPTFNTLNISNILETIEEIEMLTPDLFNNCEILLKAIHQSNV